MGNRVTTAVGIAVLVGLVAPAAGGGTVTPTHSTVANDGAVPPDGTGGPAPRAGGPPAGDAPPPATGTPPSARPTGPGDPSVAVCARDPLEFGRLRYVEQRGDVARITVLLAEWLRDETIRLYVDSEAGRYEARADLRDGNGDGRVTALLDTAAGRPNETLRTAAPADDVAARAGTAVDGPLSTGRYEFQLLGPGCSQAYAELRVEEPTPVALAAYRGDRSLLDDPPTPAAIREALAVGDLRRTYAREALGDREGTRVVRGETLVLVVEAPVLAADLAGADDAAARLRSLLGSGVTLSAVESSSSVGDGGRTAERYRLRSFGDWRVVPDAANGSVYLLLDTRGPLAAADGHTDYGQVRERYVVTVETRDGAVGRTAFELATPAAAVDLPEEGELRLPATADATVSGTSDLPYGARVTVTLLAPTSPAFPLTREATVEDGRFAATFDLAGVERGTRLEAVVRHGGTRVAGAFGSVRATATVRFPANVVRVSGAANRLRLDRVSLSEGGFVVVHRGYFGGPVVGTSAYLPPGNHTDVPVSVAEQLDGSTTLAAAAHRDPDGDRQFDAGTDPVYAGGTPRDAARLVERGGTPTPTVATTQPVTPAGTPPGLPTSSASATPPASGASPGGVPGPGPVLALVAAVAAALATRLRRRSAGGDGP